MRSRGQITRNSNHRERGRAAEYATPLDFCAIFNESMDPLYSLALALTGSHAKAEECFVAALEDCRKATGVFKQWAHSWVRLAVIENAIKIMRPSQWNAQGEVRSSEIPNGIHPDAEPVMRLDAFERFVYVLSVLNRYSSRDCAILLRCSWQEVERARRRTLEAIAAAAGHVLPLPMHAVAVSRAV